MVKEILQKYIVNKQSFTIKLLGDSITHGSGGSNFAQDGYSFIEGFARNTRGYCWANLFKEYMENKYPCTVINNGANGARIQFILDNFETLVDDTDDIIICMIGTNNRHQNKFMYDLLVDAFGV